jgi:hypothetical protein
MPTRNFTKIGAPIHPKTVILANDEIAQSRWRQLCWG